MDGSRIPDPLDEVQREFSNQYPQHHVGLHTGRNVLSNAIIFWSFRNLSHALGPFLPCAICTRMRDSILQTTGKFYQSPEFTRVTSLHAPAFFHRVNLRYYRRDSFPLFRTIIDSFKMTVFHVALASLLLAFSQAETPDNVSSRLMIHVS